jgi:hypothetical protein
MSRLVKTQPKAKLEKLFAQRVSIIRKEFTLLSLVFSPGFGLTPRQKLVESLKSWLTPEAQLDAVLTVINLKLENNQQITLNAEQKANIIEKIKNPNIKDVYDIVASELMLITGIPLSPAMTAETFFNDADAKDSLLSKKTLEVAKENIKAYAGETDRNGVIKEANTISFVVFKNTNGSLSSHAFSKFTDDGKRRTHGMLHAYAIKNGLEVVFAGELHPANTTFNNQSGHYNGYYTPADAAVIQTVIADALGQGGADYTFVPVQAK